MDTALAWCTENKVGLKKMVPPATGSNATAVTNGMANGAGAGAGSVAGANTLEYELRLQQCVELARAGHQNDDMAKLGEARTFAARYLQGHPDQDFKSKATLLLCFPPPTAGMDEHEQMDMDHPLSV